MILLIFSYPAQPGATEPKHLGGAHRGLVEPRDIVLNLVMHVITKE